MNFHRHYATKFECAAHQIKQRGLTIDYYIGTGIDVDYAKETGIVRLKLNGPNTPCSVEAMMLEGKKHLCLKGYNYTGALGSMFGDPLGRYILWCNKGQQLISSHPIRPDEKTEFAYQLGRYLAKKHYSNLDRCELWTPSQFANAQFDSNLLRKYGVNPSIQ